ncbi:hypothetical protein LQZ18_14095 [Lachnospiraceae bacterium ZAX-1]
MSEVLPRRDFIKAFPIIKYSEEHDRIMPKEAEKIVGKSAATTRRYVGILIDAGAVVKEGSTNNLVYIRTGNY